MIFSYFESEDKREYNSELFERSLFNLKYGKYMSKTPFSFIESNLPSDNFKKLPVIPISIKNKNSEQDIIQGLIDTGSDISFIDVFVAKQLNLSIIDTISASGITYSMERKPVCNVNISNEAMDGKWLNLNVGVTDTHHPNAQIILGRDFINTFKSVTYDIINNRMILDY